MKAKIITLGFFAVFLVTGILIFRDYGISWDEPIQRAYGLENLVYISGKSTRLLKSNERYYGPVFETILAYLETVSGYTDLRQIYLLRHFVNFLTFFVGTIFFFLLIKKRFVSWKWGLLGTLMLIVSPTIFAHSFYNSKDVPFMAACITAVYFIDKLSYNFTYKNLLAAAFASAVAVDIRIAGLFLPVLFLITLEPRVKNHDYKDTFRWVVYYFITTGIFVLLFWPTLWSAPFENFIGAFAQMKNYPQSTSMLYFGKTVKSTSLPWHYVFGWLLLTTPASYIISALIGFYKRKGATDLAVSAWLVLPILIVIALKSSLYDGIRQMFFVYPALIYFAIAGIVLLSGLKRKALAAIVIVNILSTLYFMIKTHPYQHVYFNELAQEKDFEQDYWGLSYKQGYEKILKNDRRKNIKVSTENFPGQNNLMILSKSQRDRFTYTENPVEADYYLTNFRREKKEPPLQPFGYIYANGIKILGIYKTGGI